MTSDKFYWHRYGDFYESHFRSLGWPRFVMEYGVDKGASICYLLTRFPGAQIVGCDILEPLPEWPKSRLIKYVTMDQGDISTFDALFKSHSDLFDLVIEDGSHEPDHQKNTLIATLPHIRGGGLYILEDLQTSHPDFYNLDRPFFVPQTNCYQVLLAIEHLRVTEKPLTDHIIDRLTQDSLFTAYEIELIFSSVKKIDFYRRVGLPLHCICADSNEINYDYKTLTCQWCGVSLMRSVDSISAIITKA